MSTSVYFFGDSICFGQYISTDQVWTTQVSRSISEEFPSKNVLTQVAAVNGETSREALSRLHHCVTSHSPSVVWIQFGLNDANFWQSDLGAPRVSVNGYVANIDEMVDRCKRFGIEHILVATNHLVSKQLVHSSDKDIYLENVKRYNTALRELISKRWENGATLIDMEREMSSRFSTPDRYLLSDGVHLNETGHTAYLESALKVIRPLL